MKLIHLSDIHFPKYGEEKHEKLIEYVLENYKPTEEKPVVIIISGDLLRNAIFKKRYTETVRHLEKLKKKGFTLLLCPGNHDFKFFGSLSWVGNKRKFFNNHFHKLIPNGKPWFGTDLNTYPIIHKIDNHYFVGIDSMEGFNGPRAAGGIGKIQLNLIAVQLAKIRAKNSAAKIIIYLHHQPFKVPAGWSGKFWFGLYDKNAFLQVIGGVDCLLFGHIHISKRFEIEQKIHKIKCIHNAGGSFDNEFGVVITEIETDDYSINPVFIPS